MGWCSGTEIMDAAVAAADTAVMTVLNEFAPPGDPTETVDNALRPFVATIAAKLRDGDWDCIEEAEHFDRFPQEMLGYDDRRYRSYLLDKIEDTRADDPGFAELIAKRDAVTKRLEAQGNGG